MTWMTFLNDFHKKQKKQNPEQKLGDSMKEASPLYKEQTGGDGVSSGNDAINAGSLGQSNVLTSPGISQPIGHTITSNNLASGPFKGGKKSMKKSMKKGGKKSMKKGGKSMKNRK